jgi:hypothetical protein
MGLVESKLRMNHQMHMMRGVADWICYRVENSSTENFTHEIYCRGIFAEIRFPKNGLEYGVLGVRSLDVVAPNFVLRDHV